MKRFATKLQPMRRDDRESSRRDNTMIAVLAVLAILFGCLTTCTVPKMKEKTRRSDAERTRQLADTVIALQLRAEAAGRARSGQTF